MTLLLIITAWLLILSAVAGLCAAASLGDRAQSPRSGAPGVRDPLWDSAETLPFSVRSTAGHSAASDSQFARAGNAAA
jgi:hypothetical protein